MLAIARIDVCMCVYIYVYIHIYIPVLTALQTMRIAILSSCIY